MRKILITILLIIFWGSCPPYNGGSFGATVFNGTSNTITFSDNSVEDLPNGDWTVVGWLKFS